jgi:hypothetical protein
MYSSMPQPSAPSGQPPSFPHPAGGDTFDLRERLYLLFSEHGQVHRLELLRADQNGQRRFLCFVRMRNEQENQALAQALGLGRFGGDLVMLIAPDADSPINPPWLSALPGSARSSLSRPWAAEGA